MWAVVEKLGGKKFARSLGGKRIGEREWVWGGEEWGVGGGGWRWVEVGWDGGREGEGGVMGREEDGKEEGGGWDDDEVR